MSWDPFIVAVKYSYEIRYLRWSPCSRFIAIDGRGAGIGILDAITLKRVKSFVPRYDYSPSLTFFPGSHLLTQFRGSLVVSWDPQTGVSASATFPKQRFLLPRGGVETSPEALSITYSGCGTMFGILFKSDQSADIVTYNVPSSASIGHYRVEWPAKNMIWTHNQFIRFATLGAASITIWEVGFVPEHPVVEVGSPLTQDTSYPSRGHL